MSRKINFQKIRESFSLQSVFNELDANLALAARIFSILCGFNEKTINKKRKKYTNCYVLCFTITIKMQRMQFSSAYLNYMSHGKCLC